MGVRPHLASLVEEFRRHAADTAVVVHRGTRSYRTTYGELAELAGRFAAELIRREIAPGDRVLLWGENSAEWIGAFFGCLLRGVIVVPLDAAGSQEFAQRVVADVRPKLIVGDKRLIALLDSNTSHIHLTEIWQTLHIQPQFTVDEAVGLDSAFQIVFTSGTTSDPKGIVHTNRNVLSSLQPIEDEIARYLRYERWVHPLRFLHTLPLSHVFGQFMGLWIPCLLGAELHFPAQVEPARMIDLIRTQKVSVLIAVPRVIELLRLYLLGRDGSLNEKLAQAKGLQLARRWWRFRRVHLAFGWRFWAIVCGGATLAQELEAFWGTLGFAMIQGYGMTETAALVTLNHPFRIGQGTVGKPLPGREVRIEQDGEILVRGEMISPFTWRNGVMEARKDEWLATGDLAAREQTGELRFLGRKSDVIVTSAGMNIYPADIEAVLNAQPGVRQCVVVPCCLRGATEPVAVTIFAGSDDAMQDAIAQANRRLAPYQQIRRVLRWPAFSFPYTATGKLLRKDIREWVCTALVTDETRNGREQADTLLTLIAEVTGEPVSAGRDDLRLTEDLHLDSLGRVQLQSLIEQRTGVEINDAALARAETMQDLRSLMDAAAPALLDQTSASNVASIGASVDQETLSYPKWPWMWPVSMARVVFIEAVLRPLVWLLAAPRIEPACPLPDEPALIIANHVTAYDAALVLYALPGRLRRKTAIAMAADILEDMRCGRHQDNALLNALAPAGYWLLTALLNVFPLPRSSGFRRSFAHAGNAMDRGYSVLIFPEGARSDDGRLRPFRSGIGLLAHESQAPVVPVELIGLGEMLQTRHWFRSGRLTIRVGEPIAVDETASVQELTALFERQFQHLR